MCHQARPQAPRGQKLLYLGPCLMYFIGLLTCTLQPSLNWETLRVFLSSVNHSNKLVQHPGEVVTTSNLQPVGQKHRKQPGVCHWHLEWGQGKSVSQDRVLNLWNLVCLQSHSVRISLSSQIPCWCSKNCLVSCCEDTLNTHTHTGIRSGNLKGPIKKD